MALPYSPALELGHAHVAKAFRGIRDAAGPGASGAERNESSSSEFTEDA